MARATGAFRSALRVSIRPLAVRFRCELAGVWRTVLERAALERGVVVLVLERAVFGEAFFLERAPVFVPIFLVRVGRLAWLRGFLAGAVRAFRAGFGERGDLGDTERFFFVLWRGTCRKPSGRAAPG